MNKNIVPIAMICDDNFVMPTCVAITSMLLNKEISTKYKLHIIMAECSKESEQKIMELNSEECQITIIRRNLDEYSDIKQMAHVTKACLLKFEVSDLLPECDKVLYIDGDVIVRNDLRELYEIELGDMYAAGVKELDSLSVDNGNINAGVMLFNAKKIREDNLLPLLIDTRKSLGDRGSMDQQTYNIVFKKKYLYIPIKYNCVAARLQGKEKTYRQGVNKINDLYGTSYKSVSQLVKDAVIIHFATTNKPWKYTFCYGAKEWYKYYKVSPYSKVPFKLRGRWNYRFYNLYIAARENGIKGIVNRITDKIKRRKMNESMEKWE